MMSVRLKSNVLWVVLGEPVASLLDGFIEGGELEVGQVLSKLVVASSLLELAIGSSSVVDPLTGETVGSSDSFGGFFDGDFVLLGDGEDDWVWLIVRSHDPQEESGKIDGVDELSSSFSSSPDGEGLVLLGADVELVDETGDDVGLFEVEVVVRTEDVGWDDRGKLAAVLLVVTLVHNVDHTLGVGVTVVGGVWGTLIIDEDEKNGSDTHHCGPWFHRWGK